MYWLRRHRVIELSPKTALQAAWALAAALALCPSAQATEVQELAAYLDGTRSLRAEFSQTSPDARGGEAKVASGRVALQKPARFRWDYLQPYRQAIVGDGERIWQYDAELEQVTVQRLDQTLGGTPLALLTGSRPVAESFRIEPEGRDGDLEWFRFQPTGAEESSFESIRLGLRGGVLAELQLEDALGQTTQMAFRAVRRNIPLDPALFRFEPPPGADVIGDD